MDSSKSPDSIALPAYLAEAYSQRKNLIRTRLAEFAAVPRSEWFYEVAFCLLTPQSKAVSAFAVVQTLKERGFYHSPFDPTPVLRDPSTYIRFHNVKAKRLQRLQEQWVDIEVIIAAARDQNSRRGRDALAAQISGMGLKEASHVLRNIGCRGLAIIDRHLLRCLGSCGVIPDNYVVKSTSNYHDVEQQFHQFSQQVGIDMDELDLLFWSEISGIVLK